MRLRFGSAVRSYVWEMTMGEAYKPVEESGRIVFHRLTGGGWIGADRSFPQRRFRVSAFAVARAHYRRGRRVR